MRLAALVLLAGTVLEAQAPPAAEFEVVSIKRSPPDARGGLLGTSPDGTLTMRNQPIRSILLYGSPVPVREMEGFPDWVARDNYDVVAKAPAGSTRQHVRELIGRGGRLQAAQGRLKPAPTNARAQAVGGRSDV